MFRNPTISTTLDDTSRNYGADNFRAALVVFLACHTNPQVSRSELRDTVFHPSLDSVRVPVFQKAKIWTRDPQGRSEVDDMLDVVHAVSLKPGQAGTSLCAV